MRFTKYGQKRKAVPYRLTETYYQQYIINCVLNPTLDLALSRYSVSTNFHHKGVSCSKSIKQYIKIERS